MNSANSSPTPATISLPATPPIRLRVRGLGNVIPFKNRKRAVVAKDKQSAFLVTESHVQKQMQAITDGFVSQLVSALQTVSGGTWTAAQQRSWIVSSLPADDCWSCIPRQVINGDLVPLGEEGADLLIERIP